MVVPRPSKTYLYRALSKQIESRHFENGLDAASANFKNCVLFRTKNYYGLDINNDLLRDGLKRQCGRPNTYGILADMRTLQGLKTGSFQVVVSTNTLVYLKGADRLTAIKELSRVTAPEGSFVMSVRKDIYFDETVKLLKNNFKTVKIFYYRNFLSRLYEGFFEKKGFLGYHKIASTKPFLAISLLLSWIEQLFSFVKFTSSEFFAICENKKDTTANKSIFETAVADNDGIFDITGHGPAQDGSTPNKPNILCISLRTPPAKRPQAILIGKMIPEWIKQGVKPVILTYENNGEWQIGLPIYKIKGFKNFSVLGRLPFFNEVLERIRLLRLAKNIRAIIIKHDIDIIFSFSNPQLSNSLSAILKKQCNIKFVSHFSDPWYDSPYERNNWLKSKLIFLKEREVILNSDKIVFVNDQLRDLVMKKYDTEMIKKCEVIPHCFDRQNYPSVEKKCGNKFIFAYLGIFYPMRTPEFLFKALSDIIQKNVSFQDMIELHLVGTNGNYSNYGTDQVAELVNKYNLQNIVKFIPPIDYIESLRVMKQSDCLIVIDANIPNSPFLPSKLIDYAGADTRILGITPKNSPTDAFLRKAGYGSFDYTEIDKLESYIKDVVLVKPAQNLNHEFIDGFEVSKTTAKLLDIFKNL